MQKFAPRACPQPTLPPPPTDQTNIKKCVQCLGIVCDLALPLLTGLSSLTNCTVRHVQSRLISHLHAHKLYQNFSLQYTSLIIYGPTRVDTPPIESLLVSFPVLSGNQAKHAEDMSVGLSKTGNGLEKCLTNFCSLGQI